MAAKLRKGDKVIVLSGKDKGKTGTISSVDPKSGKAIVTRARRAPSRLLTLSRTRPSLTA